MHLQALFQAGICSNFGAFGPTTRILDENSLLVGKLETQPRFFCHLFAKPHVAFDLVVETLTQRVTVGPKQEKRVEFVFKSQGRD